MAQKVIYQALAGFYFAGRFIAAGETVVQGHPLLKGRMKLFRPFVPTYGEVEAAPAPAPEPPAPDPEPDTEGGGA